MYKNLLNTAMILLICMVSVSTVSCIPHIRGNGKVVQEERKVGSFEAIDVSTGIKVLITQDTFEKVVVEADENIQKILKTVVHGGKLEIFLEEGVLHAKQLKVYVTLKNLKSLNTSSGSEARTENKITSESLKMHSSSGSNIKAEVSCGYLETDSSSGSEIKVTGSAKDFRAESSSGSGIHAGELVAEKGNLTASSGASVRANVTKEVKAHASSGASISVDGNPTTRDTDSSSGGSVHFR